MKFFSWIGLMIALFLNGAVMQDKAQTLRHETAAVIKLVPLRVLDPEGRSVKGLRIEDFSVRDNGILKKITEFEVHDRWLSMENEPPFPRVDIRSDVYRKIFLLFDMHGGDEAGLANAKAAARYFIRTAVVQSDEIGILAYESLTGFRVEEGLTADRDKIDRGINRIKGIPPSHNPDAKGGAEVNFDRKEMLIEWAAKREGRGESGADLAGDVEMITMVPGLISRARSGVDQRQNLLELALALQTLPGEKYLVMFSNSDSVDRQLGDRFAAAGISVFTINTKDWIQRGGVKEKYYYERHPLREFAEASGGKYFNNIQDRTEISDGIDSLSSYHYVVGYYVGARNDGTYHKLDIEVKNPRFKIIASDGYFDPKPFRALSEIERKLLLYDLVYSERSRLQNCPEISVEAYSPTTSEQASVVFLSEFSIEPDFGIPAGRTEIVYAIFDRQGALRLAEKGEIDLSDSGGKKIFPYLPVRLPPQEQEYEFRIIARNLESGQAALGITVFRVEEPKDLALRLYPPVLFTDGEAPHYLHLSGANTGGPAISLISLYPLIFRDRIPLIGAWIGRMKTVWALLPLRLKDIADPEVEIRIRIRNGDGEAYPIDSKILEAQERENSLSVLSLEIYPPDLKEGQYELTIEAVEIKTGASASISRTFIKR